MEDVANYVAVLAVAVSCGFYLFIAREDAPRIGSASDFFLYQRKLGRRQVFGTFYASGMSLATVFIAFLQLAPFLGLGLIWAAIFYAGGHLVLWLLIPKILRGQTS